MSSFVNALRNSPTYNPENDPFLKENNQIEEGRPFAGNEAYYGERMDPDIWEGYRTGAAEAFDPGLTNPVDSVTGATYSSSDIAEERQIQAGERVAINAEQETLPAIRQAQGELSAYGQGAEDAYTIPEVRFDPFGNPYIAEYPSGYTPGVKGSGGDTKLGQEMQPSYRPPTNEEMNRYRQAQYQQQLGQAADFYGQQRTDAQGRTYQQAGSAALAQGATTAGVTPAQAEGTSVHGFRAAQIGQVDPYTGATIGSTNLYGGAQLGDTTQFRAGQQQLVGQLQQQAGGQGPSMAGMAAEDARRSLLNQQLALAASSQGRVNPAAIQRGLAGNVAEGQQDILRAEMMGRLQEQQAGVQALGNVLQSARGQDIGVASTQAQLLQQAGLAGQDIQANQALQQAQLQQQAGLSAQDIAANRMLQQAQLQQQAGQFGAQAFNQAQLQGAQLGTQVNLANMDVAQQQAMQNALFQQQAGLANQQATNQMGQFNAQLGFQQQQYQDTLLQALTGQQLQAQQGILGVSEAQRQQNLAIQQALLGSNMDLYANQMGVAGQGYAAALQAASQPSFGQQVLGSVIQGGVSGLIAASDKKAKKNIKDGKGSTKEFLDALSAYQYQYKNPKYGPGRQIGVMAQDVEKSKVGKSMVKKNADGVKVIDAGQNGASAILASLAHLNSELNNISRKMNKKGKK